MSFAHMALRRGGLEADSLYYIRSRGISDKKAIAMLLKAFIEDVLYGSNIQVEQLLFRIAVR